LSNQKIFGENVVKTLGEVCQIKCGNHSTKKCNFIEGEYLIIGGGKQPIGKHNEYNCDENTILCASHGTAGYISMYPVKTFLTMAFAFIENKQLINKMYLYYYLKSIEEHLISLGKGTAQPCISMGKLKSIKIPIPSLERQKEIVDYCEYNDTLIKQLEKEIENNKKQAQIKIPIPSLERQQEIVKYLDFIYEKANKTSNEKIAELKQLNKFCLSNQKIFGENTNKKLSELCEFIKTGKNKPTDNKTGTLYPYYGTGSITGYTDEYLYDGYYILTARNGTIGNCFLTEGKFFPSDHIFVIDIKDKCLMKYVYYILSNNEKLDKLKTGVGIPNITKGTLENLIIPIPSIERQKEIVDYCEYNDTLIKQLEKEIENNKKQAQQSSR
tara:strand:- start:1236 stop:2387 length:1152 start_codon:yes stop_codon:yes gene_type:complete